MWDAGQPKPDTDRFLAIWGFMTSLAARDKNNAKLILRLFASSALPKPTLVRFRHQGPSHPVPANPEL